VTLDKADMKTMGIRIAEVLTHFLFAVCISLALGLPLEAVAEKHLIATALMPLPPAIVLVGFLLGIFVQRKVGRRSGIWVWIPGLLWLCLGVQELSSGWEVSWSKQSRIHYVFVQLFGSTSKCLGSECLYELVYTWPCFAAISYAGGYLLSQLMQAKRGASSLPKSSGSHG
jgi:hypothetical protein